MVLRRTKLGSRILTSCLAACLLFGCSFQVHADDPGRTSIFEAIDQGQLDVRVIARHAHQLTLLMRNTSEQPLAVELPAVCAAIPVLPVRDSKSTASTQPQALGVAYSEPTRSARASKAVSPWGAVNRGGVISLGPGRVVRKTLRSVCLEYGSPEPTSRDKYQLARIEDVESHPHVGRLLHFLRPDSQRVIQLAAWHLNNKMSWQQLAGIRIPSLPGRPGGPFLRREVETAYRLVEWLKASPR